MARTPIALALATALAAAGWLRLEQGLPPLLELATILLLAAVPAAVLAVSGTLAFRRRAAAVAGGTLAAALLASAVAFDLSLRDARPRDPERDFLGPLLASVGEGFLQFFDTTLPFNRVDFPLMHGLVLLAVFGFVALAGLAVIANRPALAAAASVVAIAWPGTLHPGDHALALGALALAGALTLLFLLRASARPGRGLASAAAAALVLVAVSVAASGSEAVAKGAFLQWQRWDLYDKPEDPVGVAYVWDSNYDGIRFPEKPTVVLRVKVEGPRRPLYWRATTLDEYTGMGWQEALELGPAEAAETVQVDPEAALLPERARDEERWVRQEVKVEALRDTHLIASAQPVRWETGTSAPVQVARNGSVVVPERLRQGQRYVGWSYVSRAKPKELARAPARYGPELERYLEFLPGVDLPGFGEPGREARMEGFFEESYGNYLIRAHRPVYRTAHRIAGEAKSPYEAAVALETWFRQSGGFLYDERPPRSSIEPPLVAFLGTKRGYCQHYAGAMALMLRLLGVPAREAAGFTSGTYDEGKREWVVTDHNAHTWVEAYFPGFGWLPFDPTPNRGVLSAPWSLFAPDFDARNFLGTIGTARDTSSVRLEELRSLAEQRSQNPALEGASGLVDPAAGGSGAAPEERGQSVFRLALFVVALGVGALLLAKALRRRVRFATRDPRRLAAACRRDLVGFLLDQGIEAPSSATLAELGATLEREFVLESKPFVRAVAAARFGPPGRGGPAARRARTELERLRRQMAGQLGFWRRARGALSLRSLAA